MELELASVGDQHTLDKWAQTYGAGLVEDGSLPDAGVEIVTRPNMGDSLLKMVNSLGVALDDSSAHIDGSCGFHVHVDVRDFSQTDLRKLVMLYSSVERILFELVSRSRHTNHYCQPCGMKYLGWLRQSPTSKDGWSKAWRSNLSEGLYSSTRHNRGYKQDKYHSARYFSLNLHSFFFRKTVEFRLHEAHLNPDVLANWALLCGWIVEKSLRLSEREIYDIVSLYPNPDDVLGFLVPQATAEWILNRLSVRRKARTEANTMESSEEYLATLGSPTAVLQTEVFKRYETLEKELDLCVE